MTYAMVTEAEVAVVPVQSISSAALLCGSILRIATLFLAPLTNRGLKAACGFLQAPRDIIVCLSEYASAHRGAGITLHAA